MDKRNGLLALVLMGCGPLLAGPEPAPQELPLALPEPATPQPGVPEVVPTDVPPDEPIAPPAVPTPMPPSPPYTPPPPRPGQVQQQVLPDLAITQLAYDTASTSVIVDLANLGGPAQAAGAVLRVELRRDGSARPDLVLERSLGQVVPEGYAGQLRASVLDFEGSPDLVLQLGGPVTLQATLDPRSTVPERDETNNGRSVHLMLPGAHISPPPPQPPHYPPPPPPPPEPNYVPVPVVQTPPPPAQVQVALRSLAGAWANVYVDGRLVWEPKSFDKEKTLDVRPGVYTIEVRDFMNTETWAKGRLHVDGTTHLAVGIGNETVEIYGPDGVWQPL